MPLSHRCENVRCDWSDGHRNSLISCSTRGWESLSPTGCDVYVTVSLRCASVRIPDPEKSAHFLFKYNRKVLQPITFHPCSIHFPYLTSFIQIMTMSTVHFTFHLGENGFIEGIFFKFSLGTTFWPVSFFTGSYFSEEGKKGKHPFFVKLRGTLIETVHCHVDAVT